MNAAGRPALPGRPALWCSSLPWKFQWGFLYGAVHPLPVTARIGMRRAVSPL